MSKYLLFLFLLSPLWSTPRLSLLQEGSSHVYLLQDEQKRLILKYHPFSIKAYKEAASFSLASICNLSDITPKISLTYFSLPSFPEPVLCSLQEYLPATSSLREVLSFFLSLGVSDSFLFEHLDQEDVEKNCLLLWILYDTDAHLENFRVYAKGLHQDGFPIYGIRKIDNAETLPSSNRNLSLGFFFLPHAQLTLSYATRKTIFEISADEILVVLQEFQLEESFAALHKRLLFLQTLIQDPNITYYQIAQKLHYLDSYDSDIRKGAEFFFAEKNEHLKIFSLLKNIPLDRIAP